MKKKSPAGWDTKPLKPVFYSPAARLADRFAGAGDGHAAIPDLPAEPAETAGSQAITTPYLEIRGRHFRDQSEREHRQTLTDLEPVQRRLAALRQEIAGSSEKAARIRERLGAVPEKPDEAVLTRRTAVEQHTAETLVRARRQREHDARRARLMAEEEQAVREVRSLTAEEADLAGLVSAREQILAAQIRQLHEHTLRRCATYQHHLVRKHPDGNALIPFLNLARPALPDWLPRQPPHSGPADQAAGPHRAPSRLAA
jgi:hypothetical protein